MENIINQLVILSGGADRNRNYGHGNRKEAEARRLEETIENIKQLEARIEEARIQNAILQEAINNAQLELNFPPPKGLSNAEKENLNKTIKSSNEKIEQKNKK